jgi:hypothetical protein
MPTGPRTDSSRLFLHTTAEAESFKGDLQSHLIRAPVILPYRQTGGHRRKEDSTKEFRTSSWNSKEKITRHRWGNPKYSDSMLSAHLVYELVLQARTPDDLPQQQAIPAYANLKMEPKDF